MKRDRWIYIQTLVIIILLFLPPVTAIINTPNSNSANTRNRGWLPELTIISIELNTSSKEPTDYMEYLNDTKEVIITIENTGSIVLTDVVIKFNITREPMGSPIVDQAGEDVAKSKLNISEIHQSTFLWSPSVGLGTGYTINVNVTALNFGKEISPVIDQQGFIIRDVDKDVGPVDYRLEDEISSSNGTYSNNSHQISGIVKNYANIDFSTSFTLSGSIYTLPGWQQIWNDSILSVSPIVANQHIEIDFLSSWTPPAAGSYAINISTALTGDDKFFNDNITSFIEIKNIVDAGIIKIKDYENNGIYPCTPITLEAQVQNQGNLNITSNFSAYLFVNSYPSGNNIFTPSPSLVPYLGPENITNPNSTFDVIFSNWGYGDGLAEGKYWLNISIDPIEQNGSTFNNIFSIIIELVNQTKIELECISPMPGLHYINDINDLTVRVWNYGTEDIMDYTINLTVKNLHSGEVWDNLSSKVVNENLQWGDWANIELLSTWEFNYNAKFKLNYTLTLVTSPSNISAWCTRVFELQAGIANGSFTGIVCGSEEGQPLKDIVVSILTNESKPTLKNSTKTDSVGSFSLGVPASSEGVDYLVAARIEDNYWWFDSKSIQKVFSGRNTIINLTVQLRPTGGISGQVKLQSSAGAPLVIHDWSDSILTVEDTPIISTVDSTGRFEIELAADVVNITASKANFKSEKIEYITIIDGENTSIDFTLIEDWHLKIIPSNLATDVDPNIVIVADFDHEVNISSLNPDSFSILDSIGNQLPGLTLDSFEPKKNNKTIHLIPPIELDYVNEYQIMITNALKFSDGSPVVHRTWLTSFNTKVGLGLAAGSCSYYWSKLPIHGVNVSITDNPIYSTITDADGIFILDDIEAGKYQLNFSYSGFDNISKMITIIPKKITWVNITYDDGLPVPKIWGNNERDVSVQIEDETTDRIRVDSNFTLTSDIPLDPRSVNSSTIKIIEQNAGNPIEFKSIESLNNNFKFILQPAVHLEYNSTYQVIFGKHLRTNDDREIFWRDWIIGNFTTEFSAWQKLNQPIIDPPNNAVNIPINAVILIEFSKQMNRTSVESLTTASFQITNFSWYNDNTTLVLEHEVFEYFKVYTVTLSAGIVSTDNEYRLFESLNTSFKTISGLYSIILGPILDINGNPIDGASLTIYHASGTKLTSGETNLSGYAKFYFESPLPAGNYSLEFIKKGFITTKWDFTSWGDGTLVNPIPPLKKEDKPKKSEDDLTVVIVAIVIIILIIILIFFIFLIKFRLKSDDKEATTSQDIEVHEEQPGIFSILFHGKDQPAQEKEEGKDTITPSSETTDKTQGKETSVTTLDKIKAGSVPKSEVKETSPSGPQTSNQALMDKLKSEAKDSAQSPAQPATPGGDVEN